MFDIAIKYLIGIDEVGRGPLAGPVAVGAVLFFGRNVIKDLRPGKDSKQLSSEKRDEWFLKITQAKKEGKLDYAVSFVSSRIIDTKGLSFAIRSALEKSLYKVIKNKKIRSEECFILLDGGLKAPQEFHSQKTIIKGDEKEPVIALASIAAKVTRDRLMAKYAKEFKYYSFHIHKGYGTKLHYEELERFPVTKIHRTSFLN